jgi:anaerobic selenocysteine-containing dehydrogenase
MSESILSHGVTRRTFLKATATVAAVAAVGDRLFDGPVSTLVESAAASTEQVSEDVWLPSYCRMCHRNMCGSKVHIVNGVVVRIEGDDTCPTNEGRLCARGNAAIYNLYNPYRAKAPLKRTNPKKGLDEDPGWVEISWEEALNTVSERLKKIRDDDPRKLVVHDGFSAEESFLRRAWPSAFGRGVSSLGSSGALCAVHFHTQLVQGSSMSNEDMSFCNYVIALGCTFGPNQGQSVRQSMIFADAIERGAKLVVVDPFCTIEASKGEWVPIRPGTDLGFCLALQHMIIHELGTYDVEFIKLRTNGPYLIGPDGYYVRDIESNKPLVWDSQSGQAKVFDDPSIGDYAIEGGYTVNGVEAIPGFQLVMDNAKQYTPEWAEEVTTIPAATTRRIAREFVEAAQIGSTIEIDGFTFPLRPAVLDVKKGCMNHKNGTLAGLAAKSINMLVGAMDVPGGCITENSQAIEPDEDGVVKPGASGAGAAAGVPFSWPPDLSMGSFYPFKHTTAHLTIKAMLDPETYYIDFKPEVMLVHGGNYVQDAGPAEPAVEAFKKLDFIATISYHLDEVAQLADIVMPEHSVLERVFIYDLRRNHLLDEKNIALEGTLMRLPAVEPMYNTRPVDEILIDLSERIGSLYGEKGINASVNRGLGDDYQLELDKKYPIAEIIDRNLRSRYGDEHGLNYAKEHNIIVEPMSVTEGYPYFHFPTGKTRYQIYFQHIKAIGDRLKNDLEANGAVIPNQDMDEIWNYYKPVVGWIPNSDAPADYDLFVVAWKTPQFFFNLGDTTGNPLLLEAASLDPLTHALCMNPTTAQAKGLKDGDLVWLESQFGRQVQGRVKLTELLHPAVVGISSGLLGRQAMHLNPASKKGINYNHLLGYDEGTFDPLSGGLEIDPRVKVYKV